MIVEINEKQYCLSILKEKMPRPMEPKVNNVESGNFLVAIENTKI